MNEEGIQFMFGFCFVEQSFHDALTKKHPLTAFPLLSSLDFFSQLLLAVSLLTSVLGMLSVFMSILSGGCFLAPLTRVVFLVLLLVVTALTIFISMGFVPFEFFWCFSGSSTSHDRQSVALFFTPEIHSNVML